MRDDRDSNSNYSIDCDRFHGFRRNDGWSGNDLYPSGTTGKGNNLHSDCRPLSATSAALSAICNSAAGCFAHLVSALAGAESNRNCDGYINLQNVISLHVEGKTVPQAVEALQQAYTGILHRPIITVDVKDFQKPFFTVTGQVGKPGQYDLRADITVAEAIAVAGGLQPSARNQVFLFHRTSNDWFQVEKLNLKDILNGKNANEDAVIKPGDMVFVPENTITKFRKYVPYSINAGSYLAQNP